MSRAKRRTKLQNAVWILIRSVFLVGFSFIILYPVINMVSKAFMDQQDVFDNSVLWVPKHFTLNNIRFAYEYMDFLPAFGRSVGFTLAGVLMQTLACLLAGYAFARFSFKGKKVLFMFVILTILVPPQQFMTPLYLHLADFDIFGLVGLFNGGKGLNLTTTYIPYVVVSLTGFGLRNGLFIFLFRQTFRGMPKETEEAALVDGAGQIRIFWNIMLPGAVTMIVTVMLFSFVWQWNDTYYSGLLLPNTRMLPQAFSIFNSYLEGGVPGESMQAAMQQFNFQDFKVVALVRNAGVLLVMAPLMAVYACTQRFFVESIDRSGLVG